MPKVDIATLKFAKIYPLYVQKAVRKNRSQAEVDEVICWLTGYDQTGLELQIISDNDIQAFFDNAPRIHPNADKITGVICGVRVENVEDPLVKKGRQMDKLIDELARGKTMDKILRK